MTSHVEPERVNSESSAEASDDRQGQIRSVDELLDRIRQEANSGPNVRVGDILDAVGSHSFGPILLAIGLFLAVPGPADIPGVPSIMGLFIVVLTVQIVIGREHIWVPDWLENRKAKGDSVKKAVSWMRRPAGWLDRISKPRMQFMIHRAGATVIGIACILIAMTTPFLELVPFSANLAGLAFAIFGLALLAKDGLLAITAIAIAAATAVLVIVQLVGMQS